jgi:ABC-2 type transport system ATP-binding protein
MSAAATVSLRELSKWYGEVLGLNRVSLDIAPGITSLVGPNGSGKSTLMNLIGGLLLPSKGSVEVLGIPSTDPRRLHRVLGYCTQHETFPAGFTGLQLLTSLLLIHGCDPAEAARRADAALDRTGLEAPRARRIGGYSKGMKQRLKLAIALAHDPQVLVLDEPLNGLDPQGRSEMLALFRALGAEGRTLLVSSHILQEVNEISDGVLMLQHGYLVAEGGVREVRGEIVDKPFRVRITCEQPAEVAARAFGVSRVVAARIEKDGVIVEGFDELEVARLVQRLAAGNEAVIHSIDVSDENLQAVYEYLVRPEEGAS